MSRTIKIVKDRELNLVETKIEGFIERNVTGSSTGAVVYLPKEFIGRRAYVVICR